MNKDKMMKSNRPSLDEIGDLLLQANKMHQKKMYPATLKHYLKIYQNLKNVAALCASIARCYYAISSEHDETGENIEEAVNWMKKAISISSERYDYHTELA